MSRYSPRPVTGDERIVRFVFAPIHIGKSGLKPSLFSHAENKGCSVQRASIATDDELVRFVRTFLEQNVKCIWYGVVSALCSDIRAISAPTEKPRDRAVCVYDTAEAQNRAHAEICQARNFTEADPIEVRRELLRLFGDGVIIDRQTYRAGGVWNAIPRELTDRVATS